LRADGGAEFLVPATEQLQVREQETTVEHAEVSAEGQLELIAHLQPPCEDAAPRRSVDCGACR
jgi:hypothetical protein